MEAPVSYPWAQWTQHGKGCSESGWGNTSLRPWCQLMAREEFESKAGMWQYCSRIPTPLQLTAHRFSELKIIVSSTDFPPANLSTCFLNPVDFWHSQCGMSSKLTIRTKKFILLFSTYHLLLSINSFLCLYYKTYWTFSLFFISTRTLQTSIIPPQSSSSVRWRFSSSQVIPNLWSSIHSPFFGPNSTTCFLESVAPNHKAQLNHDWNGGLMMLFGLFSICFQTIHNI